MQVGIREFYTKNGKEAPGKGISLNPAQWAILAENLDTVSKAVQDDDTQCLVKLSDLRQVLY